MITLLGLMVMKMIIMLVIAKIIHGNNNNKNDIENSYNQQAVKLLIRSNIYKTHVN